MRQNKTAKETLAFCLGILLIGCLIQAAGWLKGDRLVFPSVPEILRAFLRLLGRGETYRQMGGTFLRLLQVMAVSTVLGVALGVAEGLSAFVRAMLRPLMALLRSLPMIVLVVIVMVLSRYDRVPLIASSLFLIPLISESASEGCRRIDPELIDVYRMNSRLTLLVLLRVHLPLMAGYIRQAYISAVGMGLKMVVTTEYLVQTRSSLGKAVYNSGYFNEYQDIYAYALIMIALVLLLGALPPALGRLLSRRAERRLNA